MRNHRRWITITVCLIWVTLAGVAGLRAELPKAPERLTAIEVITAWKPYINPPKDFQQWRASPERSPGVAACSFRVEGPSFEELWNHYADLCGISDIGLREGFMFGVFKNRHSVHPSALVCMARSPAGRARGITRRLVFDIVPRVKFTISL